MKDQEKLQTDIELTRQCAENYDKHTETTAKLMRSEFSREDLLEFENAIDSVGSSEKCALCVAYYWPNPRQPSKPCNRCPVAEHTGEATCQGTPYHRASGFGIYKIGDFALTHVRELHYTDDDKHRRSAMDDLRARLTQLHEACSEEAEFLHGLADSLEARMASARVMATDAGASEEEVAK